MIELQHFIREVMVTSVVYVREDIPRRYSRDTARELFQCFLDNMRSEDLVDGDVLDLLGLVNESDKDNRLQAIFCIDQSIEFLELFKVSKVLDVMVRYHAYERVDLIS